MSVASPSRAAFPGSQASGIRDFTFEACSIHSNYGPLDLNRPRRFAQGFDP